MGDRQEHLKTWEWDWSLDGYRCRMVIEADITLNGKIILEIEDDASMDDHLVVYQMPRRFNDNRFWGIYPNF